MAVTILIPVYGVEKYIKECAESLFMQTYAYIEYIFCDDCTQDQSIDILNEVLRQHPSRCAHVRIIKNDRNLGLGGTRARLIREIQTEYFCIVDSDDILPADAIEKLVRGIEKSGTDIFEGAYCRYGDGVLSSPLLPSHKKGRSYINQVLCRYKTSVQIWGKICKTDVIDRVPNLFIQGIDVAEDICATSRLVGVATRAWTDDVVYWYRTDNDSSYTHSIDNKARKSYYTALSEILKFYQERRQIPLSLEVGILNAYRDCAPDKFTIEEVDDIVGYKPKHVICKIQYLLFHLRYVPKRLSDIAYRLLRNAVYYMS